MTWHMYIARKIWLFAHLQRQWAGRTVMPGQSSTSVTARSVSHVARYRRIDRVSRDSRPIRPNKYVNHDTCTCRTTASLSLLPAADDFDRPTSLRVRFQEHARTTLVDRSFAVAGPRPWSSWTLRLRDSKLSLSEFCRLLKTHLFCGW